MKVQYIKDYLDLSIPPGFIFRAGWTAEHDNPEGQRRIDAGLCIEVDREARARKSTIVVMECSK